MLRARHIAIVARALGIPAVGEIVNATALIVSQGGTIFAPGTRECPIIFTSIDDDVDDIEETAAETFEMFSKNTTLSLVISLKFAGGLP